MNAPPALRISDKPLLSITEAAQLAGLNRTTTYGLARAGRLPGLVKVVGRQMLVRRAVLERWLNGGESHASTKG